MQNRQLESGTEGIYVALMDADGCFYNVIFDVLLRYMIADHGHEIFLDDDIIEDDKEINRIIGIIDKTGDILLERYVSEGTLSMSSALDKKILSIYHEFITEQFGADAAQCSKKVKISAIKRAFILDLLETDVGRNIYNTLLLVANQRWVAHVEGCVKSHSYRSLLLMSGSNRQSYKLEFVNSVNNGTGFFVTDLLSISAAFEESINHENAKPVKCCMEPFLLADLYAGKYAGDSLGLIIKEQEAREELTDSNQPIKHNDYVFDETKFTLIYAAAHHVASRHPDDRVTIAFFDDRNDIQSALIAIFSANSDLLPENVCIEFWPYTGKMADQPLDVIRGTSTVIDCQYYENVRRIIELCGGNLNDPAGATIDTANIFMRDAAMLLLQKFKTMRSSVNPALYEFGSLSENASTLFAASAAAAAATTLAGRPDDLLADQGQPAHRPALDAARTPSPPGR